MNGFPILSIIIFIPLFTAFFLLFFVRYGGKNNKFIYARYVALLSSGLTLIASIYLMLSFNPRDIGYQFVENYKIFNLKILEFSLGVDSISIYFVILTAFLSFLAIFYSINKINHDIKTYLLNFLLIETCSLGVFCSTNLLLFYMFFELVLIPMYFIIGIWGSDRRIYASLKFFLYTLFGSLFFLGAIIYLGSNFQTLSMEYLKIAAPKLPVNTQMYLWWAAFITFAIKTPMIPFHTWLPDAHVEAPTAGSVMLAGILLKIGGYGLIRVCLELFPEFSASKQDFVMRLSLIAIIYSSLVAFSQKDMKKLIAYSSIAHMGYVTAAIFTLTSTGIEAAIYQMISHGLISSGLFFAVGMMYDKMHTKEISAYGGMAQRAPILATFFLLLVFASIGLPGSSGFIGELLSLISIFEYNKLYASLAAAGVVLSAIYMLNLYRKVAFGTVSNKVEKISDIKTKEAVILFPIILFVIVLGIRPNLILNNLFFQSIKLSEKLHK